MSTLYKQIGRFLKPTGTKGELKVEIEDLFLDDFNQVEHVFLLEHGTYVPYFIEGIKDTNNLLLKLEEVDDPESAINFNLKAIFLKEAQINSKDYSNQKEKEGIVGYDIESDEEIIGQIESIELFPHQVMAKVNRLGKTIYIPMVDDWILKIDKKAKIIRMKLPEGILDI